MKNQDLSLFETDTTVTVALGDGCLLGGIAERGPTENDALIVLPVGCVACSRVEGVWIPFHYWSTVGEYVMEVYAPAPTEVQVEMVNLFAELQQTVTTLNAGVQTLLTMVSVDHPAVVAAFAKPTSSTIH